MKSSSRKELKKVKSKGSAKGNRITSRCKKKEGKRVRLVMECESLADEIKKMKELIEANRQITKSKSKGPEARKHKNRAKEKTKNNCKAKG